MPAQLSQPSIKEPTSELGEMGCTGPEANDGDGVAVIQLDTRYVERRGRRLDHLVPRPWGCCRARVAAVEAEISRLLALRDCLATKTIRVGVRVG